MAEILSGQRNLCQDAGCEYPAPEGDTLMLTAIPLLAPLRESIFIVRSGACEWRNQRVLLMWEDRSKEAATYAATERWPTVSAVQVSPVGRL